MLTESIQTKNTRQLQPPRQLSPTLTRQFGPQRIFAMRLAFSSSAEDSLGANVLDTQGQKPVSVRIP